MSRLPLHATRAPERRRGSMALALKRCTADAHRRAEAAVLARRPFDTRVHYIDYLTRLAGFYGVLEPRLERFLPLDGRRKHPALLRDLARLGAPVDDLPACSALPRVASRAAAWGVAYVLEGKTLGARFLLAEAEARLGLGADTGAAFLAGYGPRTAAMWTSFRGDLEAFVAERGGRRTVLAGAESAFSAFTAWITSARNHLRDVG